MERKVHSPKEEKLTKSAKLEALPSGQIIPFDRFPNFHKWVTQCRLQQSAANNSENKNSEREEKYDKYTSKKGRKNLDAKNPDREGGAHNKNKIKNKERSLKECDELSSVNVCRDNRTRNEKLGKIKTFEEGKKETKKEKLTKKDNAVSVLRKRPHTASPTLQRMTTHSGSIRTKNFAGVVENKSVIIEQKPKRESACEKKPVVQNKSYTPNAQNKSPRTPNSQSKPRTPNLQNKPCTPNPQNKPRTPNVQNKPHTPNTQNGPLTPNVLNIPHVPHILFQKHDYSNSRGDKKIQKIVEKVDGSCVFIKSAVVESKNEKLLKENHANVEKKSQSAFRKLQRMKAFTDSIRMKRIEQKNNSVEVGTKTNIGDNRPQSADGKLQNNSDSLNNFVDEMERSFINKNFVYTSTVKEKQNDFLEVPKLASIVSDKKKILNSKTDRPQTANGLLQKPGCYVDSYRSFVDKIERSYPRYNFGEVTRPQEQILENVLGKPNKFFNTSKETGRNINSKNNGDNETETLTNTNRPEFNELNQKISFKNEWNFGNQPKKAKSLSQLKDFFDVEEDKVNTSNIVLREKIDHYVNVCVPDMCGKKIIKSIEGKIDDLERIINEKLKIGYESTDLGNHFPIFKNVPDAFNSADKTKVPGKSRGTAKRSNKFISNSGLIDYMEEKIEAYEKKYSYNFCNEAFITNLQDKVDALQKCIPMILNIEKPNCQDVQCSASDLSVQKTSAKEHEPANVRKVSVEEVEIKKDKENNLHKSRIVKQNTIQNDKPVNAIEDAKRVLAQAQNLFTPKKVTQVKSSTALEDCKQKIDGGVNKYFSLINTDNKQKSVKIEEYKNFLKKYQIVKFDDINNSNKTETSKEDKNGQFSRILNDGTISSHNKEYEVMCAERHAEVIENLQKRIEHFKNSSRITELRSKIDEIKSSIPRIKNSPKNSALGLENDNVSVICAAKNYLEETDSVMETSCEDLLKVSEDITNLDEEIKRCKTQLAFYQSGSENDKKGEKALKFATVSEKNSRCTFNPRLKYSHRSQQRPKSANVKYSKTAFGGITKIIKNLQSKMDQHEKFYQSCNEVASTLNNNKVASLEQNCSINSPSAGINYLQGSNKLSSNTDICVNENDLISARVIENLKVKVDSLTETCNVSNIRELQNKLENIEKTCSAVAHADVIRTLQAKIEKLETTLENQTNLAKKQDSTETLYSCSSSKTFTSHSVESRLSRDSKNLFDEMPACTYCMAVTLDHKPINWDKN